MALYTVKDSILTVLLKTSPIEGHVKVYEESLMKRGGFYPDAIVPQSLMESEILTGRAVTLLIDGRSEARRVGKRGCGW